MSFERLFDPNAIAIIGASSDLSRISGQPIVALKGAGFKKPIHLVNPKYGELHGLKCYPSAAAIGSPVDLALIAVPAKGVADAIRDCGKAGIPFAIVLTAGFREGGAEGRKLEDELLRAARESNVRVVGPNCQGVANFATGTVANFSTIFHELDARDGPVAIVSQSGANSQAIYALLHEKGLGVRHVHATGNEVDVSVAEHPREIAYFVPEAPQGRASIQINDLIVDQNGLIYASDRFAGGLYIFELTGRD